MKTRPGICNRKKRFVSKEEAEAAALAAPFTLRVYRCSLCRAFHLTSRTKGMKLPRQKRNALQLKCLGGMKLLGHEKQRAMPGRGGALC